LCARSPVTAANSGMRSLSAGRRDFQGNNMAGKIPVRLRKEPLLEAIWEIRFTASEQSVAELLPGVLFQRLGQRYRKLVKLPAWYIPPHLADQDPSLANSPKIRLENANQAILVGDRVIALSCRRPYSGWTKFSADIRALAEVVHTTGFVQKLDRFSLQYIDLLQVPQQIGIDCLDMKLKLAQREVHAEPVHLRTEIQDNGLVHLVQIISPAEVRMPGTQERLKGVLVDIDSIQLLGSEDSWELAEQRLDQVHTASKRLFFGLLTPETLRALEPVYEE